MTKEEHRQLSETIDLYVTDRLSPKAKADFEKRMANDQSIQDEVEMMRHITLALEKKAEKDAYNALQKTACETLRELIEASEEQHQLKRRNKRIALWRLSSIAASIVILFVFIGLQPKYSNQALFVSHYSTPMYVPVPPSRGGSVMDSQKEQAFNQALELFQSEKFKKASILFAQLGENSTYEQLPDNVLFYWAISLSETGKWGEAIPKLEHVSKLEDSEFQQDAMWYLALLWIQRGETDQAKQIVSEIQKKGGTYANKASELEKKLNESRWF